MEREQDHTLRMIDIEGCKEEVMHLPDNPREETTEGATGLLDACPCFEPKRSEGDENYDLSLRTRM